MICEADGDGPGHHSAAQAGRSAAEARARRLVLTHVGPGTEPGEAVALAAAGYPGKVAHADPGLRFVPGAGREEWIGAPARPGRSPGA